MSTPPTPTKYETLEELAGYIMRDVRRLGGDTLIFDREDGRRFAMTHNQSCCETVTLEDVCGDLDDLVGCPLVVAEKAICCPYNTDHYGHETWTFFRFRTRKGDVTLRWYGESNGYYSEDVDLNDLGKQTDWPS